MERILITGGTGFAGSHLLEHLAASDAELHATHLGALNEEIRDILQRRVTFHSIDLTDHDAVLRLVATIQPTQVYQLASLAAVGKSFERAQTICSANTAIINTLFAALTTEQLRPRVLVVSSAEVYGLSGASGQPLDESTEPGPANPYAVSKLTQEYLGLSWGAASNIPVVIARPFNHIGPRQEQGFVVSDFARQVAAAMLGENMTIEHGNLAARRDFSDVRDVVRAYAILMQAGTSGERYNIGSGTAVSIQSMLDMLIDTSGAQIGTRLDPNRMRPADIPVIVADTRKIATLGWKTTIPLEKSLEAVLSYWKERI